MTDLRDILLAACLACGPALSGVIAGALLADASLDGAIRVAAAAMLVTASLGVLVVAALALLAVVALASEGLGRLLRVLLDQVLGTGLALDLWRLAGVEARRHGSSRRGLASVRAAVRRAVTEAR